MSSSTAQQRNAAEELDYWLSYVDCALKHPHPLPSGTHAFSPSQDMPADIRGIYHCLYKLYTEESVSVPFREPVDALALEVFTYYSVVKQPMSLRVVLDRIAAGDSYSTLAQVEEDVAVIWENCAAFNGPSSPVTAAARECAERLQAIHRRFKDEEPASEDDVSRILNLYAEVENDAANEALIDYFKQADPGRLANGELDLEDLQRKHVPPMLSILQRCAKR